jgi:hypothetical protein
LGDLSQGTINEVGNQSTDGGEQQQEGKEPRIGVSGLSLGIPCSWSSGLVDKKLNEDIVSVSSGEAMTTESPPPRSVSPTTSKAEKDEEESPTDAFLRRMREDEDFGQSNNISKSDEGGSSA